MRYNHKADTFKLAKNMKIKIITDLANFSEFEEKNSAAYSGRGADFPS